MDAKENINNSSSDKALIYEEWKHAQAVISRKSASCIKLRGWIYTIISALVVAQLSDKIFLPLAHMSIISAFVISFFMLLEGIQAMEHWRAIRTSIRVEEVLRNSAPYDGPMLSENMVRESSFHEIRLTFFNSHGMRNFIVPYALLYTVVVVVSSIKTT